MAVPVTVAFDFSGSRHPQIPIMDHEDVSQDHSKMRNAMFNVLHPAPAVFAPRVGMFALPGRKPVHTPHYLSLTSRGAVPHLTQDVIRDHTSINSLYIALEDCMCSRGYK